MNIFAFLKSRTGAVSLSLGKMAGVVLTVGLAAVNIYNYTTDTPAAQEERVRSFSEVLASGATLPNDSTMNISLGGVQFVSAEEKASMEGQVFDGGDSEVAALESAVNNFSVQGSALGAGESGLGMGANAAVVLGPDGKPLIGNVTGVDGAAVGSAAAAAAQGGQTKINKLGEEPQGGLKRASMAHASGSNLGASSSGGFGGASSVSSAAGGSATAEAAARMSPSSAYDLSGAMPKGSTLVAADDDFRGAAGGQAEFLAGSRFGRAAAGMNSQQGRNLREIALASAKVAANADRSANEGTSPFMARKQLSGGIAVEGENLSEFQGTANTSFEDDMNDRQRRFNAAANELDTTEQERKAHRSRLEQMMFGLIAATFLGMMTIQAMKDIKPWGLVAAIAVTAILGATIIAFVVDASKYIDKYGKDGWSIASIAVSVLLAGGIAVAWINKINGWIGSLSNFLFGNMGMTLLSSTILGAVMGQAITAAPETYKSAFGSENDSSLKNG